MKTAMISHAHAPSGGGLGQTAGSSRWLYFSLGAFMSWFAVGGAWDIALAAWLVPLCLLRFSRTTSAPAAIGCLLGLSFADALWWSVQLGIALQSTTIAFDLLLAVLFTLPYALDRWLVERLGTIGRQLLLPSAVVVVEFAVATMSPMGATYGMRAITQSDNLALIQLISVTGPYGIGFLIAWFATTLEHVREENRRFVAYRSGGIFAVTVLFILVAGQARLAFSAPAVGTETVTIAGLAPSIELRDSANQIFEGVNLRSSKEALAAAAHNPKLRALHEELALRLLEATRKAAVTGARIVFWSETAAPILAYEEQALIERAAAVARQHDLYINVAIGVPFTSNRTHLIDPAGRVAWSYDKRHPVPGMEPIAPGAAAVPALVTPLGRLSNVICFDADFPALARVNVDIMLIPGWDWPEIGRTHTLKMARLRAVENGYSLFRQAYDGQSAAFDYLGRVLATQDTTPRSTLHVLLADVPMRGSRTIYNRVGDVFAWLCLALMLGLAVCAAVVKPSHSEN